MWFICLKFPLVPYIMCVNSNGSDETPGVKLGTSRDLYHNMFTSWHYREIQFGVEFKKKEMNQLEKQIWTKNI